MDGTQQILYDKFKALAGKWPNLFHSLAFVDRNPDDLPEKARAAIEWSMRSQGAFVRRPFKALFGQQWALSAFICPAKSDPVAMLNGVDEFENLAALAAVSLPLKRLSSDDRRLLFGSVSVGREVDGIRVMQQAAPGQASDWIDHVYAAHGFKPADVVHLRCNVFEASALAIEQARKAEPIDDSGKWSDAKSPAEWSTLFKVSWDTLKKRFDSQDIHNKKITSKSYRVHVDDLPKG